MQGIEHMRIYNELKCNILIVIIMKYRCFYTVCIDRHGRNIVFFFQFSSIFDQYTYSKSFHKVIIVYRALDEEKQRERGRDKDM